MSHATIRSLEPEDWAAVRAIYAHGIDTGDATFEARPPSWEDFDGHRLQDHRFVAVDGDARVIGWIAAAPVSERAAYRGVVEHSVYVDPGAKRRGVGRRLLAALIDSTEEAGIWTIQASIFPENHATVALHRAMGFRDVGTRERIAQMTCGPRAGQFRDTRLIERRSPRIAAALEGN
jgi:phosphinothricin acetyltransferase